MPDLLRTNPLAPRLLISATDVRSGEFTLFRSHPVTHRGITYPAAQITAEVILASAAVPTLFKAVHIDGRDYWDGVFAQNPPVRELPDMVRTIPGGSRTRSGSCGSTDGHARPCRSRWRRSATGGTN